MSSRESTLKEKFRIALTSTAKVISDDFDLNKKVSEKNKSMDKSPIEIDNINSPSDFIKLRAETDSSALKKKFSNDAIYQKNLPGNNSSRSLYNIAEKIRYEALGGQMLKGIEKNFHENYSQIINKKRRDQLKTREDVSVTEAFELYMLKNFHKVKLNPLTSKMLDFWEKDFEKSIEKHKEFLMDNLEDQNTYSSRFSQILQEMDIFQSEEDQTNEENQDQGQDNPSNDDQNNDNEDSKDENKDQEAQATLDADYNIDEFNLDEQLSELESEEQSTEQIWRVNLAFIFLVVLAFVGFITPQKYRNLLTLYYVVIYPIIAFILIYYLISGGEFGLEWVETGAWGGLSLTFIVSFFSLIFCFPLGMALALGRRTELPIIKYVSVGFIEFWRGVPLITVLFMSSVMFPMFLPEDFFMDKLVRVIIAISLFEAAYVAEVIRGGLQALPRGQYDAAKSLGMGYWKMHIFVILPQALKLVIPGMANTFLALVKDTPLIFVVGLAELAGMLQMAKTNPKWLGYAMEGYVFAAIIFWIICYAMSKYSYNLELKYKTDR